MKNTLRLFGILAVTAMIGFTMTACGGSGNGNDTPPQPPPGTNGDNGGPVPDPDNPNLAHIFDPPFVTMVDMFSSPMLNAVPGQTVGAGNTNEIALFGPISEAEPPFAPPNNQPEFNRARWAAPPAGSPAGSMTMHVFGRTHDYDGIWINLDELNYALQGMAGPGMPAGAVSGPAVLGNWTVPLLGHGNATTLVRGDRLVITGRVDTVSAYGNRNVELIRDLSWDGGGPAGTGDNDWSEIQLLAEARISSDPRAGATGEAFELTWLITEDLSNVEDTLFGRIGIISRGWAGNNLHASGIADVFIDNIAIQRAAARTISVTASNVTRVTEGVLVRAGRSMDGQNIPRSGIEVLIMPQRQGMGEIHRGVTFAFGSDSGAGPGNHLQVGDWSRFGWVSFVIPEYANHEIDNHETTFLVGTDSWDRSDISLRVAHGWDYGSEGNYLGGATMAPGLTPSTTIPGWTFAPAASAGPEPIDLTASFGRIRDIHGFTATGSPGAITIIAATGPALLPFFGMADPMAVPQGLRQQGRVLSIPMEYIYNQGRMPARGGRGGISIFSGDTAIDDGNASQNFSLIISHIVFHDGPFHTRFIGNINF